MHIKESAPPVHFHTNVYIEDDLGNVLLDKSNAIHPQNMARIIARGLANEGKSSIYRVALGNGGTITSAGGVITYKTPNDGTASDSIGWQSRLYNEIYTEVVDESSSLLGTGLGTMRINDPASVGLSGPGVRSSEQGMTSLVTLDCTINPCEPRWLPSTSTDEDGNFVFDELGLYTEGRSNQNTKGYQTILMDNKIVSDNTGLVANRTYDFLMSVNGATSQLITIKTPSVGSGVLGQSTYITFSDILPILNESLKPYGVTASMTDPTVGINTDGNIILTSKIVGPGSSVFVETDGTASPLFSRLLGFIDYDTPVEGMYAGLQNDYTDSGLLRERLLTHIIFEPITKQANRTLRLVYTLAITVAPTVK